MPAPTPAPGVSISRKLNIVLPPFQTKDGTAYVHSVPIGRATFETCYRPMARAMSSIITEGIGPITGPSVAALILQQEADAIGEGETVKSGVMLDIKRNTTLIFADKADQLPYAVAMQRNVLDEDQQSEVENLLVYFTLVSWIRLPPDLASRLGLDGLRQLWNVQTISLDSTAFMSSLKTSTPAANTGEKTPEPKVILQSSIAA